MQAQRKNSAAERSVNPTKSPVTDRRSVFERNSKKTLAIVIILELILFDFVAAHALMAFGLYEPYHDHEAEYRIQHPVYHHTLRPNMHNYDALFGPFRYPISTNSLGFKDRAPRRIPPQTDTPRLLLIGDSFTEGVGLIYSKTFAGIVAERMAKHGVEVLNAAAASYSPIIYSRKIEYLINEKGLTFDQLVVFIDISDAVNEFKSYKFDGKRNVVRREALHKLEGLRNFISDNTFVMAWIRRWFQQRKLHAKQLKVEGQRGYAINHDRSLWTIREEHYQQVGKPGLELAASHMDTIVKLSRQHGFSLTIAVYPWPDQIWYGDIDSHQVNFWQKWAKDNDVPFINYFPDFFSQGTREEILQKYYIMGDTHWNEFGHAFIAEKLIRYLEENFMETAETQS